MNQQNVCSTEARELQIPLAAKSLEQALDNLSSFATDLVRRIDPVLSPAGAVRSGQCGSGPTPHAIRCSVASGFEEAADRVRAVTDLLADALGRVELAP